MSDSHIVVIGSSNTDMVVQSKELPVPGETVLGDGFLMNPGGKGANQAVAAAKLGANVRFVAKVGADVFGRESVAGFEAYNIDTRHCLVDPNLPSGVALIMVDDQGENCISVALGANAGLTVDDVENARDSIVSASYVLIQLEIPLPAVQRAIEVARAAGVRVVLNPAPAPEGGLRDILSSGIYMITPNQTEAECLTGVKVSDIQSAKSASQDLVEQGAEIVIITMGSIGAYVYSNGEGHVVPARVVTAVDTTAAGDTFNGALVARLATGSPLLAAVEFANKAAAFSVTQQGAQSSTPTISDIAKFED